MNNQVKEILRIKSIHARLLYVDMNQEFFQWCGCVWIRGELVATHEGIIK